MTIPISISSRRSTTRSHICFPGRNELRLFSAYFQALRPGGALFIEVPNFLWILKNYRSPDELRSPVPGGEVVLKREHEIDFHAATFTTIEGYRLVRGGTEQRVQMRHVYAMTSLPELEYQLRLAGFTDLETYASYSARSREPIRGDRILISAARPA